MSEHSISQTGLWSDEVCDSWISSAISAETEDRDGVIRKVLYRKVCIKKCIYVTFTGDPQGPQRCYTCEKLKALTKKNREKMNKRRLSDFQHPQSENRLIKLLSWNTWRQPLGTRKGNKINSASGPPEETQPCWHFNFMTSDLQNCKIVNSHGFKALSVW